MQQITFVTSNNEKFKAAAIICKSAGIDLLRNSIDIDEIQGDDPEHIVRDKVEKAFLACGSEQPVVVVDDSWEIPALGGFPGAYMKYVNQWFRPDDFLRLMSGITDRRAIMHQYLAYKDKQETVIFSTDIPGAMVTKQRGSHKETSATVIALDVDKGRTIAEIYEDGIEKNQQRYKDRGDAWYTFSAWFRQSKLNP